VARAPALIILESEIASVVINRQPEYANPSVAVREGARESFAGSNSPAPT